jgi:hypothetical protein
MLMNPSFSNGPISNLLEATRSTAVRLARNHAVLSFCVRARPIASRKTLSMMRHRHLCPCLSTTGEADIRFPFSEPPTRRGEARRRLVHASSGRQRGPTEVRMRPARADFACPRWLLELWRLTMNAGSRCAYRSRLLGATRSGRPRGIGSRR